MCLNLQMWKLRRQIMTLKFAKQIIADGKLREYVHKEKKHSMKYVMMTNQNEVFRENTGYRNLPYQLKNY